MKFKTIFAKMTMCSLMLTALFGCGQASQTADGAQDTQSAQTTELTVFAAASMTETLNQIALRCNLRLLVFGIGEEW